MSRSFPGRYFSGSAQHHDDSANDNVETHDIQQHWSLSGILSNRTNSN